MPYLTPVYVHDIERLTEENKHLIDIKRETLNETPTINKTNIPLNTYTTFTYVIISGIFLMSSAALVLGTYAAINSGPSVVPTSFSPTIAPSSGNETYIPTNNPTLAPLSGNETRSPTNNPTNNPVPPTDNPVVSPTTECSLCGDICMA